jgi:hypothetical protein
MIASGSFAGPRRQSPTQINRENVHKRTDARLEKVQDSVRKATRLVSPRSSQPIGIESAGADESYLSVFVYSVSPSIAKVGARGRGWYRGVLQSPGSARRAGQQSAWRVDGADFDAAGAADSTVQDREEPTSRDCPPRRITRILRRNLPED